MRKRTISAMLQDSEPFSDCCMLSLCFLREKRKKSINSSKFMPVLAFISACTWDECDVMFPLMANLAPFITKVKPALQPLLFDHPPPRQT